MTVKPASRQWKAWLSALAMLVVVALFALTGPVFIEGWFRAQGLVVDHEGRPVPGVTVKGRNDSAVTDSRGCFLVDELTNHHKHAMPFSVDAVASKRFEGTIAAPGWRRVRVVLAESTSDTATVVDGSPAPGSLLSCEPPPGPGWGNESSEEAAGSIGSRRSVNSPGILVSIRAEMDCWSHQC